MKIIFVAAILILLTSCGKQITRTEDLIQQTLGLTYDAKSACWTYEDKQIEEGYCMHIDTEQKKTVATGVRRYILLTGDLVNKSNKSSDPHKSQGRVAAIVAEDRGNETVVLSLAKNIVVGAYGKAPTGWHLMQFGSNDYWGWYNTWDYCYLLGHCGSRMSMLIPFSKTLSEVAGWAVDYNDWNTCGLGVPDLCEGITSTLHATITAVTKDEKARVYPLLVVVTGNKKGKEIRDDYLFKFDTKKWQYTEPENYPITK